MKYFVILIAAVALSSCATPSAPTTPAAASSRAGSSYNTAIVVPATNEISGVTYEHDYIRSHYPDSKILSQTLEQHGGKPYDIMTFKTSDGKTQTLYFDISRYFGHY